MNENFYIANLIVKKIRGEITPEELNKLELWMNENPENRVVFERATDPKSQLDKLGIYNLFRKERVWSALEDELFPSKSIAFNSRRFMRLAAAIIMPILVVGGAAYLFLARPSTTTLADLDNEIKPGSQKAVLILSDGGSVTLEGDQSPTDISEGDVTIKNENNLLSYSFEESGRRRRETVFNELRTPRGGGYNLKLADGTGVWLNAGSSLKFPVTFSDSTREVYLEGEGYFEVTHTGTPFIVNAGNMDVRVLGTSFNISAYTDESTYKTTLVDGKVLVDILGENNSGLMRQELDPGQQAVLDLSSSALTVEEVNTSYFTSWMNGKIEFDNESLEVVMKRLARWYDFEYAFDNPEARAFHFSARFNRDEPVSSIFEMLEMTTDVRFEYRKGTIVVL